MSRSQRMALGAGFVALAALVAVACSDSGGGDDGSTDAGGTSSDGATPARDAGATDARVDGRDAAPPTADGGAPDAPTGDIDAGATPDSATPDPVDAADAAPLACAVRFAVDGATTDDAGTEALYVVGAASELGSWQPAAAVPLVKKGAETWSGAVTFLDGASLEFKFIKRGTSSVTWEDWGVYSNRALIVRCPTGGAITDAALDAPADAPSDALADASTDGPADAATDAAHVDAGAPDSATADAATDASDASKDASPADAAAADADAASPGKTPAVGDAYTGTFNVKPADAT